MRKPDREYLISLTDKLGEVPVPDGLDEKEVSRHDCFQLGVGAAGLVIAGELRNSNSERPSFDDIHMEMARLVSNRSTCRRLSVGCVIASEDNRKILATGYNGNATGFKNDCDTDIPGSCGCLHAEQNAVINCDSPRYWSKVVFVTDMPCKVCAKFLVNLGNVKRVWYARPYRLTEGVEILERAGISCKQFEVKA